MSDSSDSSAWDLLRHRRSSLISGGISSKVPRSTLAAVFVSFGFVLSLAFQAYSADLTCSGAATLEALMACIEAQMPRKGSQGFAIPKDGEIGGWRSAVSQMLGGSCEKIRLSRVLKRLYLLDKFHDTDNGRDYCVLMEISDRDGDGIVDHGWGTFVTNSSSSRELSIQIPHPIADLATIEQGIGVFKETDSRSFLIAGTHRDANSEISSCQSSYPISDVAHNDANLFQVTEEELLRYYDSVGVDFVALQFHGMGSSYCAGVDVYLTHGRSLSPVSGDKILELQSNLVFYNPEWVVVVPGESPSCNLHGSTNVQGRLLNGVGKKEVCYRAASEYSGKFVHIEQKADFRSPADWIDAIMDTWP